MILLSTRLVCLQFIQTPFQHGYKNIIRVTQRGALADRIVDDITTAEQLHVLLQCSLSKELHHFGLTPTDLIPEG